MEEDNGGWKHISEVAKEFSAEMYAELMESRSYPLINREDPYFQKLRAIKEYYLSHMDKIMESGQQRPYSLYRSYPYDWSMVQTPIEVDAWNVIRCKGRLPLYPQFPVLNYHLDFACPIRQIGLELDGKEWHTEEKDRIRDTELRRAGWKIYRIPGKEMVRTNFKDFCDWDYDDYRNLDKWDEIKDWILHTGDGVIEALKVIHFDGYVSGGEKADEFKALCTMSLYMHQLVK